MNTEHTTDPATTDSDTEGHVYRLKDEDQHNDNEGHGFRRGGVQDAGELDSNEPRLMRGGRIADADTEGHGRRTPDADTAEGDTEGHGFRVGRVDDADTEGHGLRRS